MIGYFIIVAVVLGGILVLGQWIIDKWGHC